MEAQVVESAPVTPVVATPVKKAPVKKEAAKKEPAKKVTAKPAKKEAPAKKTPVKKAEKKAPAKPKEKGEVKNGVTRPLKGTASAKVWEISDAAAKTKAGAVRKTILEKAAAAGINAATAATQFARWRVWNGITGAAK